MFSNIRYLGFVGRLGKGGFRTVIVGAAIGGGIEPSVMRTTRTTGSYGDGEYGEFHCFDCSCLS